jgi:hypothetical protein
MAIVVAEAVAILERTPAALRGLLAGLPDVWTRADEGPGTWSPYDIVGHLVHGERTDWIPRLVRLLEHGEAVPFAPFDRFAQFTESKGRSLADLLDEFSRLRAHSLRELAALDLGEADLGRTGTHPAFGRVTLAQLLATWTAHDLGHLAQACRAMAGRYRDDVGPWREYLPIVAPRR